MLLYFGNVGSFSTVMVEITTKVASVTLESFFKNAVLFKDVRCDEVATKSLEAFASYGLKPTQINVRSGDQVFNYEMGFSLFNGNGTFRISADKLDVVLKNATNDKDLEIVQDCVARIYELVSLPEVADTSVSANAHATFSSVNELQNYLSRFTNPDKQIISGGAIAHVLCPGWKEEIRMTLEKSLAFPEGLFLTWSTLHRGGKPSRDTLQAIQAAFALSVTKFDLSYSQTNQT